MSTGFISAINEGDIPEGRANSRGEHEKLLFGQLFPNSVYAGIHPPGVGLETPPGVGLETPPRCGPGDPFQVWAWSSPWVWGWRPPRQTPQAPQGVGIETCKACWDAPPRTE